MTRNAVCLVGVLMLLGPVAHAQGVSARDSSAADRVGVASAEVWAGYSPGTTRAGVLGRHGDLTFGLAGVRFNYRFAGSGDRVYYYALDLIPFAQVGPLIEYETPRARVLQCNSSSAECFRSTESARGAGASPLGITAVFGKDRVQWRLGANGGFLIFNRPAPSDIATRFNFTAALEGGVQVVSRSGKGVLVVYRLHHLSNAGTGDDNLAMLSHVLSIGARWRRPAPRVTEAAIR